MSYEIIKNIVIDQENNEVFFTSANSSLKPLFFEQFRVPSLEKMLKTEGLKRVEEELIYQFWSGNFKGGNSKYKTKGQQLPFDWNAKESDVRNYIKATQ